MLLKEIKHIFHKELDVIYAKEEVASFFYLLIEHYLDLPRFVLAIDPDMVISKTDETPLFEALSRLKLQEPIQYIIGSTLFMDMEFEVDENVLIPRPETEELVQWVLHDLELQNDELCILDIGTGSGCIAISLAKHLSNAQVFALDVSKGALKIAKNNALTNEVEIETINASILELERLPMTFDVIVSNPPYVRVCEKKAMSENVVDYEPGIALFVSDENPLIFYDSIAVFAERHLKLNGSLYFEINQYLGKETEVLLKEHNFSEIELRKDMYGNDRMLKGKNEVSDNK